jgi:hypothetical protein
MTSRACFARGCIYDSVSESDDPFCSIPIQKGGYKLISSSKQILNDIIQYNLSRISIKPHFMSSSKSNLNSSVQSSSNLTDLLRPELTEFSMYGHDIDHLNVQISISGTDMIRLTIRDADNDRYEVPVPIQWQPTSISSSTKPKIQFEMTKTSNGQSGFRVKRTDTQTIIFDTSFFAHGFVYDNQFIQFVTTIPSTNVYGKIPNQYFIYRRKPERRS